MHPVQLATRRSHAIERLAAAIALLCAAAGIEPEAAPGASDANVRQLKQLESLAASAEKVALAAYEGVKQ